MNGVYIQNRRELVLCPELLIQTERDIATVETASNPISEMPTMPINVLLASFGRITNTAYKNHPTYTIANSANVTAIVFATFTAPVLDVEVITSHWPLEILDFVE